MNQEQLIDREIEKLFPSYTEFLSELVRTDSSYGKEKNAQLLVKSRLESMGLNVKTFYSRQDDESLNLVSVFRGTHGVEYRSLGLNAHCDVAPVDVPGRWIVPPFSGEIKDGVLYGRGSQDDKAGVVLIILVVNVLKNLSIPIKGDLTVQSVIEDESSGNGTRVLVENGYTSDGVIICDGTWSNRIIYAHLGQVYLDVEVRGDPVAACSEHRGVNPIYIAIKLIQKLNEFIDGMNRSGVAFENIERPYFLNVGAFHSGVWHGSVPAEASLKLQIGFPDKYSPDEIIEKTKEIAGEVSERITIRKGLLKTPAYKTDPANPLLSELKSIIQENSGKEVSVTAVTGYCDMRHFPIENICLYGPGGGKNAHGIDECYYSDELKTVAKNIICFVLRWCNKPKHNSS